MRTIILASTCLLFITTVFADTGNILIKTDGSIACNNTGVSASGLIGEGGCTFGAGAKASAGKISNLIVTLTSWHPGQPCHYHTAYANGQTDPTTGALMSFTINKKELVGTTIWCHVQANTFCSCSDK